MRRVKTLVKIRKLFHKVASGNLVNKVECWLPTITPRTHQLQRDVLQDKKKKIRKEKLYFELVGTVHKEDFLTRLFVLEMKKSMDSKFMMQNVEIWEALDLMLEMSRY